jgi:large subunit ribosomal protein L7/L12
MTNLEELVKSLSALTVMEASQLSKMLEEHWGVSAAAPVAAAPVAAAQGAAPAVQTSFDVVLASVGDKKLDVIKEVRAITGLDLASSKALVESAPKSIKSGVEKDEAESIKAKLEAVGAKVELK